MHPERENPEILGNTYEKRAPPYVGMAPEWLIRLLTTPILPRRLSSVISKFSHKNNFRSGVTPWRVPPRGGPPPPHADATG